MIQRQAVEGNMYQQHNLAVLYTLGIGVPFDLRLANRWFESGPQGQRKASSTSPSPTKPGWACGKLCDGYQFYNLAAMQGLPSASIGGMNWGSS